MLTRTRLETATFARPFKLAGLDTTQPAGAYRVEIEEELLETLSFPAYRRTGTWIRHVSPARLEVGPLIGVVATELESALAEDSALAAAAAAPLACENGH
jgi:hypothetical protein